MPEASRGTVAKTETMAAKRSRITLRALALLDMGIDKIMQGDPATPLLEAYKRDPLAFLERAHKLGLDPGSSEGKPNSINNLFVLAAKQASQLPALPAATVIDAEVSEVGVQSGSMGDEPIEW